MKKLTTQNYIYKANLAHGNLYNYNNTNYTTSHDKIEIECKKHGRFKIAANDHLKGHGCPACGLLSKSSKL